MQGLTQQPSDVADVLADGVVAERATGGLERLVHDRPQSIQRCFGLAVVTGLLDMHLALEGQRLGPTCYFLPLC
ncbi:hypothetical protein ACWKSP_35380 [Micromonosporaceae bacterium Da 78-11]